MAAIPYFIYTSGEKGMGGIDWGVKFSSLDWGPPDKVDTDYREIIASYKLAPSLERPSYEVGILILPMRWGYLFGLIIPYYDSHSQGNRPNISLLGCKVTHNLISKLQMSPGQMAAAILNTEGLISVAKRLDDRHPEFKQRPDNIFLNDSNLSLLHKDFMGLTKWPKEPDGLIKVNNENRMLKKIHQLKGSRVPKPTPSLYSSVSKKARKKLTIPVTIIILLILILGCVKYCMKAPSVIPFPPKPIIERPSPAQEILNNFDNSQKASFEYVAISNNSQRSSLLNDNKFRDLLISSIKNPGDKKQLMKIKSLSTSDKIIMVSKEDLLNILKSIGDKWVLDWDQIKNEFEIQISAEFHSKTDFKKKIDALINEYKGNSVKKLKRKYTIKSLDLTKNIDAYLDKYTDRLDETLKERILFLCPTFEEGVYFTWYLKDNNYGKLLPKRKILTTDESLLVLTYDQDLLDVILNFFEVKTDRLIISDVKKNKSIVTLFKPKKVHDHQLTEDEKSKIILLITKDIISILKDKS